MTSLGGPACKVLVNTDPGGMSQGLICVQIDDVRASTFTRCSRETGTPQKQSLASICAETVATGNGLDAYAVESRRTVA